MRITIIITILILAATAFAFSPSLTSFNAGQTTLEGRTDFAKYNSACRTLENMMVMPQGPVTKRPGTKYIATVSTPVF